MYAANRYNPSSHLLLDNLMVLELRRSLIRWLQGEPWLSADPCR